MEQKKETTSFLVECENCKKRFPVTNDKLTYGKEFKSNGQSIFLTYYDCPHCGKRHFVQIDDAKSKQMLVGVTVTFTKLAAAKKKGKAISKKQSEKFKKARQNLSGYRMNLMKEFTGKTVIDKETGIEYVLRFSV